MEGTLNGFKSLSGLKSLKEEVYSGNVLTGSAFVLYSITSHGRFRHYDEAVYIWDPGDGITSCYDYREGKYLCIGEFFKRMNEEEKAEFSSHFDEIICEIEAHKMQGY